MTLAPASSSSCGAQGAVGDRSAATRRANSRGARYLKLLCGRSSLYSSFHTAIFALKQIEKGTTPWRRARRVSDVSIPGDCTYPADCRCASSDTETTVQANPEEIVRTNALNSNRSGKCPAGSPGSATAFRLTAIGSEVPVLTPAAILTGLGSRSKYCVPVGRSSRLRALATMRCFSKLTTISVGEMESSIIVSVKGNPARGCGRSHEIVSISQ